MFLRFYHSSQTRLAVYGLGLTQIAQISRVFFVGGKSHGGSPLIFSKGSHRFNEIQQEDYSWKFVAEKIFTKKYSCDS